MAQDTLVTPPIRQSVEDANSAAANGIAQPSTEKSWYLYWDQLGKMANRQNWMVNVGTHADRPPADTMPQGAIYVEFDRGVIYQNWSGSWQYLAGTMWGTLSPDQRPTDLGSHDAGFDFRTTDQPPREFIWNGTAWVEVTSATVGTHANRPASASEAEGNLYVESDRGGVIYQNWVGGWHYLAGTMWGTLSPDQRPTDLGANDTGFAFHGTDYPRTYIWNGTAWIETTLVRWGSHAGRLALTLTTVIDGELFVESDRTNVMYQNQGGTWHYAVGTMWGTLSPDQRPTDLGPNDVDFQFGATDTKQTYRWDGTAWVLFASGGNANYWVNGSLIGTRPTLNLIAGSNVTIAGSDNAGSNRVDVTVTSSGGGGTGGAVSSVFARTGAVVAQAGDYSAYQVTNAVDQTSSYTNPAWILSLAWSKITGAPATGVSSVFGRSGAVVASTGDYTAAQVTNAVDSTGSYANPAWITTLAWSKITGAPSVSSYQTPWLSNINAANFNLYSVGSLGIGVVSPLMPLHFHGATNQNLGLRYFSSRVSVSAFNDAASANSPLGFDASQFDFEGGRVGIGTASPGAALDIEMAAASTPNGQVIWGDNAAHQGALYADSTKIAIGSISASALGFYTGNGAIQMTLGTNGGLGLGLSASYQLQLSLDLAGKPSTSTWSIVSDIRTKRNVTRFEGDIELIRKLDPIVAEYNGKGGTPEGARVVSFEAEKLRELIPHAVTSVRGKLNPDDAEESDVLGVNIHEILFHMLRAVQQIDRRLEQLEAQVKRP